MRVTLKMIAKETGVSTMAVSAALNNTTRTRISKEKREYIRKIANEMGYSPNVVAQSLSGGKTRMVGVIIDSHSPDSCIQVLRGIEEVARLRNYRVIVAEQHDSMQDIVELCKILENYGVDGIIALAHDYPNQQSFSTLYGRHKNIVFWEMDDDLSGLYVGVSAENAFKTILSSWQKNGRKNPALVIGSMNNSHLTKRINSYKKLCNESGLEGNILYSDIGPYDDKTLDEMRSVFKNQIIPKKVDSLLMESDFWALAMLKVAQENNCKVPDDLAIVGWDDNGYCSLCTPTLASVSLQPNEQGKLLLNLLLDKLENKKAESVEIPAVFKNRESSGI